MARKNSNGSSKDVDLDNLIEAENDEKEQRRKNRRKSRSTAHTEKGYSPENDKAEREYHRKSAEADKAAKSKMSLNDVDDDDEDDRGALEKAGSFFSSPAFKRLIMPVSVAAITGLVAGALWSPFGSEEDTEPEVRPVDSVEGAYSILDDVESLKDDRILSLHSQIAGLNESSSPISVEEMIGLTNMSADALKVVEPFISAVLGIDRNATNAQMTTHQDNLSDYMAPEASTTALYDFLNGPNPARQLGTNITKSGPVTLSWAGSNPNDERVYRVHAPIASELGAMSANYTISITENGRISGIDYNGVTFGATTPVETSLAEQIQGNVPSPSEDSGNTSTKDSDDTDTKDSEDGDTETDADTDGKSSDDTSDDGKSGDDKSDDSKSGDDKSGDGDVEDRTGVERGSVNDTPADDAVSNKNNEQ